MSLLRLAEALDSLADKREAVISEAQGLISVFDLSARNAVDVVAKIEATELQYQITDAEGTLYLISDVNESFGPYIVTITKPFHDGLCILTNTAFSHYLSNEPSEVTWYVARLRHKIVTYGRIFLPWNGVSVFELGPAMKNPRSLVKEASSSRIVTSDIRPWILRSDYASLTCSSSLIWVQASIDTCLKCLPDEVDASTKLLKFKGPPKREVSFYSKSKNEDIDISKFQGLQTAVAWIFELENQSEIRSLYFKAEVVRSGLPVKVNAIEFLDIVDSALEGAKIAYSMSVSELGKDTIKALADLKKTITEDTSKLTEATRQIIGAVAAALAVGIGLLAARISANASIDLILGIMVVVALYVGLIIATGWNLVKLQRQLRDDWHPKIYRFLTDKEYEIMVATPAKTAEFAFTVCSIGGGIIVCGLVGFIFYTWLLA